jgi:septal ring factor EnvC (AmiA/AmiB activator)
MKNKCTYCFIICSFLFCLLYYGTYGQIKNSNQKESNSVEQIQKSIDQTNLLLSGSKEEKKQLLKRLELLQSQISYRKELQEKLTVELQKTESEIKALKLQNSTSVESQKLLEAEYAKLLKNKLIHRLTYNPILSLLHPGDIDKNVKHWYLLERIERERQNTLANLRSVKTNYYQLLNRLTNESFKQDSLLKTVKKEEENLQNDISKSQLLVKDLNTRETGLNADLIAYKKRKDELNKLIESSIKSISKSKNKTIASNDNLNIKYPLKDATIISRFGKNMEAGKSKLLIRNNGIDLQSKDPFVKISANSEVVEIRKMPNQLYLLITKANNMFVVYSNLENVLLRNGEKVEQGVNLGKAVKNEAGYYELHFETWIEKTPTDPLQFLK